MCPVILLALISSLLLFLFELTAAINVVFHPANITIKEENVSEVKIYFKEITDNDRKFDYYLNIEDPNIAHVLTDRVVHFDNGSDTYNTSALIRGKFLGLTRLSVKKSSKANNNYYPSDENVNILPIGSSLSRSNLSSASRLVQSNNLPMVNEDEKEYLELDNHLPIIVTLKRSLIQDIFTVSVIVLVTLNYVNMGCALNLDVILKVIKRPLGPAVGFAAQYLVMPLLSYLFGYLLFEESFLRLGLFTFGCSPGGGASNMWTVLLNGNLDLSVTMTFLSTLAASFMMPLWLFTLGRTIFIGTTSQVPIRNILSSVVSMVIALGVGVCFQKFLPKVSRVCKKILAPVSIGMIIFIIIFGTYANLFMFKYMSWQILLAAALNVWFGFLTGLILSFIFRFKLPDITAISIETGIQNTGVAIILLRLSLPEPNRDLASVVPVAASLMTPIPLTIVWIAKKINNRLKRKYAVEVEDSDTSEDEKTKSHEQLNDSKTALTPKIDKRNYNGDNNNTNENIDKNIGTFIKAIDV